MCASCGYDGEIAPADAPRRNIEFLGHTDQGGRGDGVQIMVQNGYAYVGHMFSGGLTVIDVRDPCKPTPVRHVASPPHNVYY